MRVKPRRSAPRLTRPCLDNHEHAGVSETDVRRRSPKRPPDLPKSAPPRPRRAALATAVVVGVVLVVAIGLFVTSRWRVRDLSAQLPAPPPVSAQQKAVEQHLRERYETAMRAPSSIAAVGPLCLAYHADMLFDAAERCYEVAGALAPGEWRWTYYRAVIQSERGGGEALVANLREVVERAPQFGPAWLRLGEAEFKAGRYNRAADAWRKARDRPVESDASVSPRHVTETPLSAYASLGLARVALVRGEFDAARQTLEQLLNTTPQFGSALRLLAESYRKLGREAEAERFVYRAGRVPPYSPYADPVVDELARESRNSILLLRLASEANLAINAEWSEYSRAGHSNSIRTIRKSCSSSRESFARSSATRRRSRCSSATRPWCRATIRRSRTSEAASVRWAVSARPKPISVRR